MAYNPTQGFPRVSTGATTVITGTWNPAIFQAGWIAEHLFGVPKGQQLEMAQRITTGPHPKSTYFYANIGISVTTERLELYCNRMADEVINNIEEVCLARSRCLNTRAAWSIWR
jgi:hypothetical protein